MDTMIPIMFTFFILHNKVFYLSILYLRFSFFYINEYCMWIPLDNAQDAPAQEI